MDKQITNKIVKIEDIIHVADMLEKHSDHYRGLIQQEEIKYNEAKSR